MEEEARAILGAARLGALIHKRFMAAGGAELRES
jgi:hypothetical protein